MAVKREGNKEHGKSLGTEKLDKGHCGGSIDRLVEKEIINVTAFQEVGRLLAVLWVTFFSLGAASPCSASPVGCRPSEWERIHPPRSKNGVGRGGRRKNGLWGRDWGLIRKISQKKNGEIAGGKIRKRGGDRSE